MRDILHDIGQYSQHLSISNVVTLFERKGVTITKSMIQNYVRDKLLPPPVNKRHYTHRHLAVLALATSLKTAYEMVDIKAALLPLMEEDGIPLESYHQIVEKTNEFSLAPHNRKLEDPLILMTYSVDLKEKALQRLGNRNK